MRLDKVDWYKIYKKWTMNSGVFEYLFKSSPFVTAKYMENFELNLNKDFSIKEGLREVLKNNIKAEKILLVDVDVSLGVKIAINLNNEFKTVPILAYNFLFHPYGVVGSKELIEDLVAASELLGIVEQPKAYAFIIDSSRYIEDINLDDPMVFNNQYEITDEEMPDISTIRKLNIKEVSLLYKGAVKEDIASYLEFLKENDIKISAIDLGELLNE
ncbi:hypothetical protein NBE98_02090 [Clostridium swellfunianum]|uniref:hypothetical protein n=1 Tax=Clostridium swellfunianum TaxID=1367462 RepID=UPI00202F5A81|nr:hypothetical protein [Clostridium swellfunianum]MCM0647162.1 hypothetical protein [Clostridium swellfunianum]